MGYAERMVWAGLIAGVAGFVVYLALVVPQLGAMPVAEIAWVWPMVGCITGGIVLSIVVSIVWGIVAGMRDPDLEHRTDLRDRDIEQLGARVGQGFGVIGGLAGIVLAMVDADRFWIANAIFVGFFLAAVVGGVAQLIAYRKGLV